MASSVFLISELVRILSAGRQWIDINLLHENVHDLDRDNSWRFQSFMTLVEVLTSGSVLFLTIVIVKRRRTKIMLENVGLPTVYWRPRFMTYRPFEEDEKMASSTITKILPRMQQLQGPYGMYGTVYGISTPVIHVAHPVPAKAILCNSLANCDNSASKAATKRRQSSSVSSFVNMTGATKSPAYNHFKNFCGEGVFTADGDDWKTKRAAVIHCLIKGVTNSGSEISQILEKEANDAADRFCQQVDSLNSVSHQNTSPDSNDNDHSTVNVIPLLQRSTIGLIYHYITHDNPEWMLPCTSQNPASKIDDEGEDAESISLASSEEMEAVHSKIVDYSSDSLTPNRNLLDEYLKSIVRIRMIILAQSRSVWFTLPRWCYQWFSSLYRDEERTLDPIKDFARTACENAKPSSPLYKLSGMEGPYRSLPSGNQKIGDSQINKNLLDEAITLLFAGQDTSAATLSWTLHLLSLHTKVQDKLANEIQHVVREESPLCDDNETTGKLIHVTKKLISKLPYLDAVIKEAMRLYPVAPFIVRRLTDDICVPTDNEASSVNLPADAVACIWIYGLHHNPEFWNEPDAFLPERWLDPKLKDLGQTNGAYMPFAFGPRNCLGQPLAYIILRVLLCKMVFQYELIEPKLSSVSDPKELRKDMQAGFTVLPTGKVELVIRKRRELCKEKFN